MSDRFKAGDKVRVIFKPSSLYGKVFNITDIAYGRFDTGDVGTAYVLDAGLNGKLRIAFEAHELEPVYDGSEKSSWSECAWNPNMQTIKN